MGRRVREYSSSIAKGVAAGLLAISLTACFKPSADEPRVAGAKPAAVKGLKDKPCIKVNASQDTGPYSLFDVPADMIEAEFIMAAREAKPKWQIYSEHAEPPCEANVFVDVKGLSYSLDRQQSFDTTHTTLGVGGGLSVYVPGAWEQPSLSVALSDSVPGIAKALVEGLEQDLRAARSPHKPRSRAKPADEGKFCYSLATANRDRYEDLAQNFFHTSRNRTITNPDGYRPSEDCIPDFYVSSNDIAIRSSSGIEGSYGALALRVPGETRSRIYLATGPGYTAAMVSNINEMSRVLGSLERGVAQKRAVNRHWSDDEITSVLEQIVSTSSNFQALNHGPNYAAELYDMRFNSPDPKVREEGARLEIQRLADERKLPQIERQGAEAITLLRAIMLTDADRVRRVANRYGRTLKKPQREMLSEVIDSYTDIEQTSDGRSPFITAANNAWRKKYD